MHGLAAASSLVVTGLPPGGLTAEFEHFLAEAPPAGVLLFRRDFGAVDRLPALVRRLRGLAAPRRLLICMDEEGGFVSQLAPDLPVPPSARVLGRAAAEDEVEALGRYSGGCLRACGVDVDFAPVLDVDSEAANPVIGPRSFSSRVEDVARLGLAFARGLRAAGAAACAKHFPGHGDTLLDSHVTLPRCAAPEALLRARDLAPFRAAIAAGMPMIMVSHVHYPALEAEDRPATLSPRIVTGLLRGEMGFQGIAVTDAMEMKAVAGRYAPPRAARMAIEAGCDLLLYGAFTSDVREAVARLAEDATAPGSELARRREESGARVNKLWSLLEAAPAGGEAAARAPGPVPLDLVALGRRALRWVGDPPAARPGGGRTRWLVVEPRWEAGIPIAELLRGAGWRVETRTWEALSGADLAGVQRAIFVHAGRTGPTRATSTLVALAAATLPTCLVALGQDAFLAEFPAAHARLSACDAGEPMRRAVAQHLLETCSSAAA